MKKFALIGAGSLQFTTSCVRDLLTFPAFEECEIRLMDINKRIWTISQRSVKKLPKPCSVPDAGLFPPWTVQRP